MVNQRACNYEYALIIYFIWHANRHNLIMYMITFNQVEVSKMVTSRGSLNLTAMYARNMGRVRKKRILLGRTGSPFSSECGGLWRKYRWPESARTA